MSFDAVEFRKSDGSTDSDVGPTAPKRFETHGIPSVPGEAWVTCYRLYAPLEPYINRTWVLPDIEKVKCMGEN